MASAGMRGESPLITRTFPTDGSTAPCAAARALPVPPGNSCTAKRTRPARCASRASASRGTTTTGSSCPAAASAERTWSMMGRPPTGWSGLGRADRIRAPAPAAKTTACHELTGLLATVALSAPDKKDSSLKGLLKGAPPPAVLVPPYARKIPESLSRRKGPPDGRPIAYNGSDTQAWRHSWKSPSSLATVCA